MKKTCIVVIAYIILLTGSSHAGYYDRLWQEAGNVPPGMTRIIQPAQYRLYTLRSAAMQSFLNALPGSPEAAGILQLPAPDGSFRDFRVWQTPVMEAGLAAKYPQIKTFTAVAVQDQTITAKLDYTPYGFHAMVYDGSNTCFIDPYSNESSDYYQVYYKRDYTRPDAQRMHCGADGSVFLSVDEDEYPLHRTNGSTKRTYRLALACTGEYAVAVAGLGPSKAAVLARMVLSVNRVNGVYERELAVTLQLAGNTDTLIFLDGSSDPYTNSNGSAMMAQNQTVTDSRIGIANYDIGHVFSTGGGGIAQKGSVCNNSMKARGVTGAPNPQGDAFDIDYVAHEIGHQFGADHTFNTNIGSCGGGNRVASCAYEPGSGSTIMAYAGLCGADNLQPQGSAYFHARSLEQITTFLNAAGTCAITSPTGNTPVSLPAFSRTYNIPFLTPFELTAPDITGSISGTPTWCWEEWDLSNSEQTWSQTRLTGPVFRSFEPDTSRTRVFPQPVRLVNNVISYVGEKLPDTGRELRFRLTARHFHNGTGCFNFPDDSIVLNVIRTTAPFSVTNPNASAISWTGGSSQTVTWQVAGTNAAPISCSHVDIYLSVDGGYTYPFLLLAQAPNTGSATVTVPNTRTTANARIKVKGNGNVFFDISNENFMITHDNNLPYPSDIAETASWPEQVLIYPVPARELLHVRTTPGQALQISIYNTTGQIVWEGRTSGDMDIPVSGWTRGVYYLRLADTVHGRRLVRAVVIQ